MAAIIRKAAAAANVVFALSGITVTGTFVQGYENDYSSDKNETPDNVGETVAVAYYNAKKGVAVDGLYNSATPLAFAPGDALTINSIAGHLDRFRHMGESQGWQKVRLEITSYVANTLT